MRHTIFFLGLTAIGFSACMDAGTVGDGDDYDSRVGTQGANPVEISYVTADGELITADALGPAMAANMAFILDAANHGSREMELSREVAARTSNPAVINYAQMLVTDHTLSHSKLAALAAEKNMAMPQVTVTDHEMAMEHLEDLREGEFDSMYLDMMISDHKDGIERFQAARNDVEDAQIRDFIDAEVKVLQKHLQAAEAIRATVN